jgi:hypothetical protein
MEQEESDLYGLPLDEFVPKRSELEKRLRKDGDRERAAAVKKLPKPTVAAWAVNQASRCRPKERRALMDASAELRDVQERLMSGDASAADLERAASAQREAIDGLVEAAAGLLTSDGKSMGDATLARVRETLSATATDPDLAELVEAGTLDRERQATGLGFGFELGAEPPAPAKPKAKRKPAPAAPKTDTKKDAADRKRREKEERAARERAKAAKSEEREAAKRLEAAERAAARAAKELEKRERQLDEAREAAEAAHTDLERARADHAAKAQEREAAEALIG